MNHSFTDIGGMIIAGNVLLFFLAVSVIHAIWWVKVIKKFIKASL